MTIYTPLSSGVLGTDSSGGLLDHRHPKFQHPQENAMSPDQFDQLKKILEEAADRLAARAHYEAVVNDLGEQLDKQIKEGRDQVKRASDAEAAGADLKAALDAAQANLDVANKQIDSLRADSDKKDSYVTDLRAELTESRDETAQAYKALNALKKKADDAGDKGGADKSKGGKDKGGAKD